MRLDQCDIAPICATACFSLQVSVLVHVSSSLNFRDFQRRLIQTFCTNERVLVYSGFLAVNFDHFQVYSRHQSNLTCAEHATFCVVDLHSDSIADCVGRDSRCTSLDLERQVLVGGLANFHVTCSFGSSVCNRVLIVQSFAPKLFEFKCEATS